MKRVLICVMCLVLLCGCNAPQAKKPQEKLTIVTTIFPLYDFARQICGEKADVKMLIKPGSEVHSYDPLPSDMKSIYDSDLFLYIGGESDKWVDTMLDAADVTSVPLISCVAHHNHDHNGEKHADEHIWTSTENAVTMLKTICAGIISIDCENAAYYQANCDDYVQKIVTAAQQISGVVAECENPFILVADRFPFVYFTEEFGIDYEAAFDGCAVSTDISMKTMLRITKTIQSKNVKTVFVTELSSKNIAKTLHTEYGVKVLELHSAHNVTLDDFNNGITYVDILYRNSAALKEGLK